MPVTSATGKLNGPMTPNTPNGRSTLRLRSPGESVPRGDLEPVVLHDLRAVSLDQVDGLLDLGDRLRARLAGLERHDRRHLEHAVADDGGGRAHEAAAVGDRRRAPAVLRLGRDGDRLAHDVLARLPRPARDLAVAARVLPREHVALGALRSGDHLREGIVRVAASRLEAALERGVELGGPRPARIGQPSRHDAFYRLVVEGVMATRLTYTGGTRTPELDARSEEHTSELQSHVNLVCRLLLE